MNEESPISVEVDFAKQIVARLRSDVDQLRLGFQAALRAAFNGLFLKFPNIITISWSQHTPYHNDGEPCEFRVYNSYPEINGQGEWVFTEQGTNAARKSESAAVKTLLKSLPDDVYLLVFGDHKEITVSRDGFVVDDTSEDHE